MKPKTTSLTRPLAIALLTSGFCVGVATAQTSIQDADNDTRVETARTGDDDVIRLRAGGLDRLQIVGQRIEPLNTGNSIFLGAGAGRDDNRTNNNNAFIGSLAGQRNVNGQLNTAIGFSALRLNVNNSNNTAIGPSALLNLAAGTTNNANTGIGPRALDALTAGNSNLGIGTDAGGKLVSGAGNTMLGHAVGANKTGGDFNTLIGTGAGSNNAAGSNNVMIGYLAGSNETGSDKLYVANSATANPLIKGDFAEGQLAFNVGSAGLGEALQVNGATTLNTNNDLVSLGVASNSADDAQFIEFERGSSTVAQINADGSSKFTDGRYDGQVLVNAPGSVTEPHLTLNTAGGNDLSAIRFDGPGSDPMMRGGNGEFQWGVASPTSITTKMNLDVGSGRLALADLNPTERGRFTVTSNSTVADPHVSIGENNTSDYARLELRNTPSGTGKFQIAARTFGTAGTPEMNFFFEDAAGNGNNIMTIEAETGEGGQVGIGTTGPSNAKLVVARDANETQAHIRVVENEAAGYARIEFDNANSNSQNWQLQAVAGDATNDAIFQITHRPDRTNANENVIVHVDAESDRVGINTTSPSADLHVVNPDASSSTATLATLRVGSGEEFRDEGADLLSVNASFIPRFNGSRDLGTSALQWRNLYLSGSVLFAPPGGGNQSARGAAPAPAGLEEVLKLAPAAYDVVQADGSTVTKLAVTPESLREAVPALVVDEVLVAREETDETAVAKGAQAFSKERLDAPAIDQLGLIPVLVQAIQDQHAEVADLREENAELQAQLDQLAAFGTASGELAAMLADMERTRSEIEQLQRDLASCCTAVQGPGAGSGVGAVGVLSPESLDAPALEQNAPNPFHTDTRIRYYLPAGLTGEIVIYDNLGRELARSAAEEGVNFYRVSGGQLARGTYRYALIVEGTVVDSKQMVLTR